MTAADVDVARDADDFERFYRDSRDRVAGALALTFRSEALGADAADEAMARALARWGQVSSMDNPSGWVYRVGLNWGRSVLRRSSRETLGDIAEGARLDPDLDPDLDAALAALDVKHRAVVVLRHLLGHSERETAQILGISEGTVKSRSSRALTRLRAELRTDKD